MSKTLIINSAFSNAEVVLIDENAILNQETWPVQNEMEEFLTKIFSWDLADLAQVVVHIGPGRFMSLRTGLALAQSIANFKKISLKTFTTKEYADALLVNFPD